ncbi:hypothetical protein E0L36_22245 [Streptomyces sp. AJS327]|uniref:hypothetical protein n=1 Tax=Streptomyces sp. AJS327 TaxID=2545265 RepID=UPI0015DEEC9F|nr:hypothetical protein [Streptomyces sp. AJS327]MBA0053499.1 hypothetical protein [Streptomyces sp. AJS327]
MAARIAPRHSEIARRARAARGNWVLAAVYPAADGGQSAARRIPRAERMPAYHPPGTYEAYDARHDDGTAVWVRYTAGLPKPAPRPPAVTYRVCDRGTSRSYEGVRIVAVTVSPDCPRCGGPRGSAVPYRFPEDGEWYVADKWKNGCGHTDMYAAVLAEGRELARFVADATLALDDEASDENEEFGAAVALLRALEKKQRFLTARRSALLLAVAGHDEAARRVEEERTSTSGRMSARDAAQFLVGLAAARASCTDCDGGRINYQARDSEFVSLRCGRCRRDVVPRA